MNCVGADDQLGDKLFKYKPKGRREKLKHKVTGWLTWTDPVKARQETADSIISSCNDSINDKIKRKTNYHDTYIQEILHIIDEKLSNPKVDADIEFEVSLKQHICGSAAREFQKMHEDFIQENDPYKCLQKDKNKFCAGFKDVFYKRDQCQKKAEEFTNQCLKPAVENFIYRSLGLNIIDEMLTGEEFSTRMSFQYSVLMDLISRNEFELYLYYICSYEDYLKSQISDRIKKHFSDGSILGEIEDRHLESSISNINGAIKKAIATDSLKTFVEEICKELGDKLVISQDALGAFLVLNNADQKQFAHWLTVSVKDMAEALRTDIQNRPFETKLSHLHVKPHVELFNRVIGCGQQCPFCAVPCDAGGKLHTEHFASLHRPQGLGEHRWKRTEQLMTDICSSLIVSGKTFCCSATKDEWHLYKNYKEIYPNWDICPDVSLEASDYWKYVMAKYNQEFAKAYMAKPADIPPAWNNITEQQAKESLKESFNINLSFPRQQTSNIFTSVSLELRKNLKRKGSHACELLSKENLKDCGQETFTYKPQKITDKAKALWARVRGSKTKQEIADSIISACNDYVSDKIKKKTNYHDTYIQEILHIIDERLNKADVNIEIEFEVSLKQHICGSAAREFQKIHSDFIQENDPYKCLQKNKEKFCTDFKDVFHERDQCQKKAQEFTKQILKPAVENEVYRSLHIDIIQELKGKEEFSTRMSFQYSILLDLISKDTFETFNRYICSYEEFVKQWISKRIKEIFSSQSAVCEFEERHLKSCITHINAAIKKAKTEKSDSLNKFVENICTELGNKLVISQDALNAFMVLNNADQEQFGHWLNKCVEEMTESLREKFENTKFHTKLSELHVKPDKELFNEMIGCGQQCPFCKIPCEAGAKDHKQHFASVHRSQGLGQYRWDDSKELITDVCTSLVISDKRFCCEDTNDEWHDYKQYQEIYPDWNIPPDGSFEASDYWKYVMAKYNKAFADEYDAESADIPDAWKRITKEEAKKSLKKSFNKN
ncbi:hypothetical protein CCH79_00015535 [Gambusia affinis]|uniref:VLIG-type G domain-containing protein n=1 Tax=Gambusia affinis TaxID=33528 RepID=A0A315WBR7_GAMAF|nr:hypothetical protein CCH79_00015535 [Gambusia affinis]